MASRSPRRARPWGALLIVLAVAAVAVFLAPMWWERQGQDIIQIDRCTVTLGDRVDTKTAEQANNMALITAVSIRRGLPARAATIAIATAIQESFLRNIDYGDRDSIGLFQQRPSQGWGTVEQIMDPYYSTNAFYDGLIKIEGWEFGVVTEVAQSVQRSAFPDAYADHEEEGRLWASALTGNGGDVTCSIGVAEPTTARAYLDRVDADFGDGFVDAAINDVNSNASALEFSATDSVAGRAFHNWAIATAWATDATSVASSGTWWTRGDGDTTTPPTETEVLVTIPTAGE